MGHDSGVADMAEGEERPSAGGNDENGKYPIGFRFKPTTEELVEYYLRPKLLDQPTVPNEFLVEADAYGCDPEILTEKHNESGVDDTWYFLSPRYRKYPGGDRPVRRTADDRGRWKPSTGQSKPPEEEDASTSHSRFKAKKKAAFSENTLAYYVGSTKDETKTKWLMHELVVPEPPANGFRGSRSAAVTRDDMLLNRYVVCRIYKSPLRKWKQIEVEEAEEEVPTSSQAPECAGEAPARAPSSTSRQPPAKRSAVERPATSGHTGAPNKGASQTTWSPGGRLAPTRGNGGGRSVRMPLPAGAGAPPLLYGYGNRAAGMMPSANAQAAPGRQGPPLSRPRPPHRAAATATAPNSQGSTMMRPAYLVTGQPAWPPFPWLPPSPETEEAYHRNRVYARLIAEMKLQKAQQDSSSNNKNNLAQRPQRQQSSTATPGPAAVETLAAAENVPSKQSMTPSANEGSGKGNASTIADNIILQILSANWPL